MTNRIDLENPIKIGEFVHYNHEKLWMIGLVIKEMNIFWHVNIVDYHTREIKSIDIANMCRLNKRDDLFKLLYL